VGEHETNKEMRYSIRVLRQRLLPHLGASRGELPWHSVPCDWPDATVRSVQDPHVYPPTPICPSGDSCLRSGALSSSDSRV
jgi:hypothetical protein